MTHSNRDPDRDDARSPEDAGDDARSRLDRVRDEVLGALAPNEREALASELEADSALAEFAEEYRLVAALTAQDAARERSSSTTFARLLDRDRAERARRSRWRKVASIAALFAAAAGGAAIWVARERAQAAPVELHEIWGPESFASYLELPPAIPTAWADYAPREGDRVRWLTDVDEATRLARATERPLLVYGFYPGCPLCKALDENVFTDATVVGTAERFVPVRMDLSRMPEAEAKELFDRGYPFLEAWCVGPEEKKLPLERVYDAPRFEKSLERGIAECPVPESTPDWPAFRELVRKLEEARGSLMDGAPARAESVLKELSPRAVASPFFSQIATAGFQSIARDVHERFFRAQALASTDVAAAESELERLVRAYTGTRYERDLRATLDRVHRDGRFPPIRPRSEIF